MIRKLIEDFTDHEHLDDAQLIHMNGRVYDYNLGRFLSVDPFIQAPGNSQSMNPYSYIMNNPLAGTDPSGYLSDYGGVFGNGGCDLICASDTELLSGHMADGTVTVERHNGSACKVGTCGGQAAMVVRFETAIEDIEVTVSAGELEKTAKEARRNRPYSGATDIDAFLGPFGGESSVNNDNTGSDNSALAGAAMGLGREISETGNHRLDYENKAKNLGKDDKEGRKRLKAQNREGLNSLVRK